LAAQIALYGAPIAALAQGLTAVAETLRLSDLVDFVVESCLVGGQDTFADCLYLVDPGVSRVSGLEYGAIRGSRLAGYQEGTVEKHISSILIKLNLQEADDDHRRVLPVITSLKAR
jgi:hypothetical protein